MKLRLWNLMSCGLLVLATTSALAQDRMPGQLREVGFDQNLGTELPLDAVFVDENGVAVELGQYFDERPVILALVYYECPMLCNMVLNGLTSSLSVLKFDIGREFDVLTVSFDPDEPPSLAAEKKNNYVADYGRSGAQTSWHFLTGEEESIRRLTEAAGFRYVYDPETDQYAHASGVIIVTPEGKIARYFYGIEYAPKDLRFGLIEASQNRIGTVVDQALLYCFRYDPESGTYSAVVLNIVRLGGVLTIVGVALLLLMLKRREKVHTLSSRTA